MPQFVEEFSCREDAVEALVDLHELDNDPEWPDDLATELREDGFVDLNIQYHGNEYAEVTEISETSPECGTH
jgi:hypothetical protein